MTLRSLGTTTRAAALATLVALGAFTLSTLPSARAADPATQAAAPITRRYVNSLADFMIHVRAHVQRVEKLGLELVHAYPKLFGDVPTDLLGQYLRLHDRAKIDPASSAGRPQTFAEELYDKYAIDLSKLPEAERLKQRAMIDELNKADGEVGHRFFKEHGLLNPDGTLTPMAKKFVTLEKVADQVDRGLNPVSAEEFNKVMQPASRWMTDPVERELAAYLEMPGLYRKLTVGMNYQDLRPRAPAPQWLSEFDPCAMEALSLFRRVSPAFH